jgi:predicted cobalt transporter CbtA
MHVRNGISVSTSTRPMKCGPAIRNHYLRTAIITSWLFWFIIGIARYVVLRRINYAIKLAD